MSKCPSNIVTNKEYCKEKPEISKDIKNLIERDDTYSPSAVTFWNPADSAASSSLSLAETPRNSSKSTTHLRGELTVKSVDSGIHISNAVTIDPTH